MMAIGSDSVVASGAALRARMKRRVGMGVVVIGVGSLVRFGVAAKSAVNRGECWAMKYPANSRIVWYSKNNVLDSEPNVFSNWFVSFIARIESMPYSSSAACGSIL